MGQGHYNAIGFGCLRPKSIGDALERDMAVGGSMADEFYDLVSKHGGHTGYESRPDYIAIFLADSGCDHVTMAPTSTMADFVKSAKALVVPSVVAKWERIRREVKRRFGIALPAGRLLFIADYD